jgi:cysteinyl-tRNA synthetase
MKMFFAYQKALLHRALKYQQDLVEFVTLFTGIDDKYVASTLKELEAEYATVTTELTKHFCTITGFNLVPVQNQKEIAA